MSVPKPAAVHSTTRLETVNGVRLNIAESGAGDPLVLVHGSWDDRRVWAAIEDDLARHFHVVSYDRRGHTHSEDSSVPGTRADDETDLARLIELLDLAPANVVANSFGASIALGLATRRPDLFRTLCTHEPPLLNLAPDDPVAAEIGSAVGAVVKLIEAGEGETAAQNFVESFSPEPGAWEQMSYDARAAMTANAHTFADEQRDPWWADIDLDALGSIDFPVLLTRGEVSPPVFTTVATRLAEKIPGAEVALIPGADHDPHTSQPRRYVETITRFAAP